MFTKPMLMQCMEITVRYRCTFSVSSYLKHGIFGTYVSQTNLEINIAFEMLWYSKVDSGHQGIAFHQQMFTHFEYHCQCWLLIPCSKDDTWYQCILLHQHINQFLASNVTCLTSRTDVLHCIINTSTNTHIFSIKCHMFNVLYRCMALHHQHVNWYSHSEHRMSHA
jgi:hypothetical protein